MIDMNNISLAKKYNLLMAFSLLQFLYLLLITSLVIAAVIQNFNVFVGGIVVFVVGCIGVLYKYIRFRIKFKRMDDSDVIPIPPNSELITSISENLKDGFTEEEITDELKDKYTKYEIKWFLRQAKRQEGKE